MKKQHIMLVLLPMLLASCGGNNTTTFDPSTYAGYSIDLNGDGTIAESEKNLTWAKSYDQIIADIKGESDDTVRFKKMHAAEDLLMDTGCVCPLYYYTDAFMKKTTLTGFYAQPLGIKFFDEATYNGSGKYTVCIASQPTSIDPHLNSTVDGGTMDSSLFQGLTRWGHVGEYGTDGYQAQVVEGDAKEAKKTVNADGTVTYKYTLKDNLKWSDGTSYDATDYVRSWKRAVSSTLASDYAYLYEAVVGGAEAAEEADGASLSVTAEDATHLTVNLVSDISYWDQLTAFPTFYPVPKTADNDGAWIAAGATNVVSNGAMKLKSYDASSIVMEANPYYVDKDRVKATEITYAFSDDEDAMLRSYKLGSNDATCWALIDDVAPAQMKTLQETYPNEFFNPGQLGTYYVCFNIRDRAFDKVLDTETKRQDFRKALGLMVDRNYIIDDVAQNGATAADGFVSLGLTEPDGKDWTKCRNKTYYSAAAADQAANEAAAVQTIKDLGYNYDETKKKFTNVPTLKYIYNTSDSHKAIAEALQSCFAKYGITMTLDSQEWATFIQTRKSGDYSVARNGWLCDYNDPISMLDMWVTESGNNDVGYGKQPITTK